MLSLNIKELYWKQNIHSQLNLSIECLQSIMAIGHYNSLVYWGYRDKGLVLISR